jgi:DNA-binding NtrC family response regulator
VCATNRDLEAEVKRGAFREDLFYRINVVPVHLPALRERREDIPQLILHFAQRFAKELNRSIPQFSAQAMDLLVNYPWPGNVRELEHAVERLLVTCDSAKISVEDLPFVISKAEATTAAASTQLATTAHRTDLGEKLEFEEEGLDLTKLTEEIERKAIEEALRRTGGVITEAARTLKITRRMLRYKMDKLGIPPRRGQGDDAGDEADEESAADGQN